MKQVKIVGIASDICWWKECVDQVSPVLDTYEPTGYIKIRVTATQKGFEHEPFQIEGWLDPKYVESVQDIEPTEQPSDSGSRPSELEAFGNDCVTGKCEI